MQTFANLFNMTTEVNGSRKANYFDDIALLEIMCGTLIIFVLYSCLVTTVNKDEIFFSFYVDLIIRSNKTCCVCL